VTRPGYQSLRGGLAAGADVTLQSPRTGGWAIDLDLLRRQVTPATRLIVVNAPHNPTGMVPDRRPSTGWSRSREAGPTSSSRSTAGRVDGGHAAGAT
jgi:aspartate/methionine/tyrosine aminotransferase